MTGGVTDGFRLLPGLLRKPDQPADIGRRGTLPAQFTQSGRAGRLGELLACRIANQAMVPIDGLLQT
jgi:hypothetical protein